MIYILIGFLAAFVVNVVAYFAYGAETFWQADWVNYASLLAILGGILAAFLSELRCNLCRILGKRWRIFCTRSCHW